VGWEKVASWSTKAARSLKRVKIKGKLLWRPYRNSPMLFRTVPSPTPYSRLFPKIGGSQPHLKFQSLLSEEQVKLRTSNLANTFTGSIKQKPSKNFRGKGEWAYPGIAQFYLKVPHIISGTGKATNFKFCTHIHRTDRNKSPLQISGKVAVGVDSETLENFQGNHI